MASGSVKVQIFKDRLRLVWSWQGKRFWLYIGLPDTIANRKAASMKASQIELDMASGNLDPSLTKYKPQKQQSISVSQLFDQFVEYKRRKIEPATLAKYMGLEKHVSAFFNNKSTISVSETVAEKFRDWLLSGVGEYDAFLPQHPTDTNYWEPENLKQHCYRIDSCPYLLIAEGPFKAISGCSNGLPTIALMGIVWG